MKTTTQIVDEEHEYLREKGYLEAERYEQETQLMWEIYEEEQRAKVVLGKVKKRKSTQYARVTTRKFPRFLSIQSYHRRIQADTNIWNRSKPPIHTRVSFRGH
jgi:uncharacterized protein with NAD-binding domain and iron-sulfur cluster